MQPNNDLLIPIKEWFAHCDDVHFLSYTYKRKNVTFVYCEGIINDSDLRDFLKSYSRAEQQLQVLMNTIPFEQKDIIESIFAGNILCIDEKNKDIFAWNLSDPPKRTPEESNTDASVRGPRDAFVEELSANVALIRKRVRSNSLCFERFTVGEQSHTQLGLLYMRNIVKDEVIEEARNRIKTIKVNTVISGAQVEELISDKSLSLFPLLDYSSRSDFVIDCMMNGRVAILMEGSPNAIIAPTNFTLLFKSPEDAHVPFFYAAFGRLFRFAALFISVFLIGLAVALVKFHQEQVPLSLLATIIVSRAGVPLTIQVEAFLIIGLFEMLREAGARLPKAIGQTLATVGGLIIGDAAIRAGLVSPSLVVITAITTVSTFVLVNQSLASSVTLLRLFVLLCSAILGLFGFIFAASIIFLYMTQLQSFGVPYLSPLTPLRPKVALSSLLKVPWGKLSEQRIERNKKE